MPTCAPIAQKAPTNLKLFKLRHSKIFIRATSWQLACRNIQPGLKSHPMAQGPFVRRSFRRKFALLCILIGCSTFFKQSECFKKATCRNFTRDFSIGPYFLYDKEISWCRYFVKHFLINNFCDLWMFQDLGCYSFTLLGRLTTNLR